MQKRLSFTLIIIKLIAHFRASPDCVCVSVYLCVDAFATEVENLNLQCWTKNIWNDCLLSGSAVKKNNFHLLNVFIKRI